jgi:hypothetical protein
MCERYMSTGRPGKPPAVVVDVTLKPNHLTITQFLDVNLERLRDTYRPFRESADERMVILPVRVGEDWHLPVILPSKRQISIHTMATSPAEMLVPFHAAVTFADKVLDMRGPLATNRYVYKQPIPPEFAGVMFGCWAARYLLTEEGERPTAMEFYDVFTEDVMSDVYSVRNQSGPAHSDGGM